MLQLSNDLSLYSSIGNKHSFVAWSHKERFLCKLELDRSVSISELSNIFGKGFLKAADSFALVFFKECFKKPCLPIVTYEDSNSKLKIWIISLGVLSVLLKVDDVGCLFILSVSFEGHLDMVRFLLEAGADQEHKTDEMHTALMEACMVNTFVLLPPQGEECQRW